MSVSLLPIALTLLANTGDVQRLPMPDGVTAADLYELAGDGEVVILPLHHASPFRMAIATRSAESCSSLEKAMMRPEEWPRRWDKMKNMKVTERAKGRVAYHFQVDMFPVSPTVHGIVEVPAHGEVLFRDPTGQEGHAVFDLFDVEGGCAMLYHIWRPPGQRAAFAKLITRVESRADDAGEIGGALATTRGWAVPEKVGSKKALSPRARAAWDKLSEAATVIRIMRRGNKVASLISRRKTSTKTSSVLWTIRNRRDYENKLNTVTNVDEDGAEVEYTFGFFGGRVSVETGAKESGGVGAGDGLHIREQIHGGDLDTGGWTWRVQQFGGGTDVELSIDADLISGSLVWRTLAAQDPVMREAMQLQLVLAMMGDLIGGRLVRPHKPGLRAQRIR